VTADREFPVADAGEVEAFLRRLPLRVDAERFVSFARGFPTRYLAKTPPLEVVRHYGLMEGLGKRAVITSLAREGPLWQLCVVARDRSFLFAHIAGSLSAFGMSIVAAEAFANANALVLDTFRFADPDGRFEDDGERRAFQHLLEEATSGRASLPEPPETGAAAGSLQPAFDDLAHPQFTRLVVEGPDRFGLLFRVARVLSESGCSIEIAYIATPESGVHDEFFLSEGRARLHAETKEALGASLRRL
jgi:[protein-PII] uridylyltransferase